MAGTDPVNPTEQANQRVEAVVGELADLIGAGHTWDCANPPEECPGTDCASVKAREVLAYLYGAGVLYWGQGHQPLPRPPEGAAEAYAVRLTAEFWHPRERTPQDLAAEVTRYAWLPWVVAVASGYEQERISEKARTFTDELTGQQAALLRQLAWVLYGDPDSRE